MMAMAKDDGSNVFFAMVAALCLAVVALWWEATGPASTQLNGSFEQTSPSESFGVSGHKKL